MSMKWIGFSKQQSIVWQMRPLVGDHRYTSMKWYSQEEELQEALTGRVDASILLIAHEKDDMISLCEKLTLSHPYVPVVIVDNSGKVDLRTAMRAGAIDVIALSTTGEQAIEEMAAIEKTIEQKKKQMRLIADPAKTTMRQRKIITVCSTKGGVGKTTLAVNLAVSLANHSQRVALIDLNLQFGDVSLFCDLKPKMTIYDWAREKEEQQERHIEAYLEPFNPMVHILSAPQRPEFAEFITEEHVRILLEELRQEYDIVLIDSGTHLDGRLLMALENSDEILMLTYLDLPTLKNVRLFIDTLESLTLKHKVKVVLNKEQSIRGLSAKTAEKVLGLPLHARLPHSEKEVITSVNEGKPFAATHPNLKLSREISSIAKAVLVKEKEASPRPDPSAKTISIGGRA